MSIKTLLVIYSDCCENYGKSLCCDETDSKERKQAVKRLNTYYNELVSILKEKGVWDEQT